MEEFLKDKIFQFYYKKIYGKKSNYQSFKTFTDKDKVSFLINLYLFISNINNNNKSIQNSGIEINYNINNENDIFYQDNYNKIMNEYFYILNKYNNDFHSKLIINDNKENYKNIIMEEDNKNQNKISTKNSLYIKKNINNNKINSFDTDNYFEEKKFEKENDIVINSQKNDIDINIENKQELKYGKYNYINNNSSKMNKMNNLIYEQNFQYKSNNINNINNYKNDNDRINNLTNNNKINNNQINNLNSNNKINSPKNNNSNLVSKEIKEIILTEHTLSEKSLIHLEEFTNDNIVEKLIKCPQNKYISLNCSEANKIALVIINLMESKNDLEIEIEEERKKNEIKFDKLKLDYEKQKNDIKSQYNKKEDNVIQILGDLEKEINDEKSYLEEEQKGYNLWDHISIENQRTKEIKENIMKKLDSFK
jgi:hypothetical protein